jgi:hypothetical protein
MNKGRQHAILWLSFSFFLVVLKNSYASYHLYHCPALRVDELTELYCGMLLMGGHDLLMSEH